MTQLLFQINTYYNDYSILANLIVLIDSLKETRNFFFNLNNSLLHSEYVAILIFLIIAIVISLVIVTFSYILAVQNPETEKLSSYECGFEPYEDARTRFEVKYYLIAILFIVFDVETMFLLPWAIVLSKLSTLGFWSMVDFIIELGIGFVYVWNIGALEWDSN